jgi:hypothetical protein
VPLTLEQVKGAKAPKPNNTINNSDCFIGSCN